MEQREIKFRVWDKEEKKFISQSITDDWDITIRFDGIFVSNDGAIDGTASGERLILIQYVGLKDKNKKEIYEGDIVSGGEIVSWRGGAWGYDNIVWSDNIEVLGNIYENPELLKEEK